MRQCAGHISTQNTTKMYLHLTTAFTLFLCIAAQNHKLPCHPSLTADISTGIRHKNNSVSHNDILYENKNYFHNGTHLLGCVCNVLSRCVRKCCPMGEVFHIDACVKSNHTEARKFKLKVHHGKNEISVSDNHFDFVIGKDCTHEAYILSPENFESDESYLQLNGSLFFPIPDEGMPNYRPQQDFCFDNDAENNTIGLVCFPDAGTETDSTVYSIGMLISMPFLLVTFIVYAFVPELQNIHGKCLMCYVATLLTAYIFLVSVQLNKMHHQSFCVAAPFIIYFSFMVSFMWLNVMCIDIFWTFSGRKGFRGSMKQSEHKRFLVYSIYAWSIPLLMLAIAIYLQFAPELPAYIIRPSFGEAKCWFPDDKAVGYYFYGPILLIILANLGLFTYTTIKIWNVQRDTDQSMKHESQRHGNETDKQRYKLYLKLMLVFGVNWLMEIVSWMVSGPNMQWLWYVTDMCNAMYGVFIFFIFVCKANVWKLLRKRYHVMMGRPYLASTFGPSSSTRSTAMSQTTAAGPDSFALTTSTAA